MLIVPNHLMVSLELSRTTAADGFYPVFDLSCGLEKAPKAIFLPVFDLGVGVREERKERWRERIYGENERHRMRGWR